MLSRAAVLVIPSLLMYQSMCPRRNRVRIAPLSSPGGNKVMTMVLVAQLAFLAALYQLLTPEKMPGK